MKSRFLVLVASVVFALSGCVAEPLGPGGARLLANQSGDGPAGGRSAEEIFQQALNNSAARRTRLGTDDFLGESGPGRTASELFGVSSSGEISLNLVGVPIREAARAVLGEALGKSYNVDDRVVGTVTLQTTRPLSEEALIEMFQAVLELSDATLQTGGGVISVVPVSAATRRVTRLEGTKGPGARIVAVPLQFIGTAEMTRLLEPIIGPGVSLDASPSRNILLVSGNQSELAAAVDAINLFDVDVLRGKSVGLYRLNAAEPVSVAEELSLIFEAGEGGSLQNVVSFVPSSRLGGVLVITSRKRYLAEAEQWIKDLDRTAGGQRRRPVVYSLQNRKAIDVAPILSQMLGEVGQSAEGDETSNDAAKVIPDDAKNAVVVWGNSNEQEAMARLIQILDTTPVQVLLEATIAEVSLNDDLSFGLRWFFEAGDFRGTFSDVSNGAVAPSFPGLSFLFQGASAAVALNALASVTNVNVISSPSIMVLDNQEALLQIGDEVPVATQQVTDTSDPEAPVVNTIEYRDTGIILKVKPRVSASGRVVLDIEQEVSDVSNTTTSGIDSPTISQRLITTSVVVSDGETLALGGLIQESGDKTRTKVPLAGDIPVIGNLFRRTSDTVERTELLVLITPRVVRDGSEARGITAELRRRINGADANVTTGVPSGSVPHRIFE